MPIFDLFSKRQKKLRGEVPDVYTYDDIPQSLRVQIVHIIEDCIGKEKDFYGSKDLTKGVYESIFKILCREYGKFSLIEDNYFQGSEPRKQVLNFLLQTEETEEALDVIELTFKYLVKVVKEDLQKYLTYTNVNQSIDDGIKELNERFKESGIGYSFESGELIRIDSTYIHSEVTKETLKLIANKKFTGANEEYLKAHEHYRNGRNKEALADCLKAFESTLKIICKEKNWSYNETDTSRKLIQICFTNNLVPTFSQNQFTSLQNLIESGIPTIRNKLGGHGQGQTPQKVDDEITRYGINLTGANIIFLIEQSKL